MAPGGQARLFLLATVLVAAMNAAEWANKPADGGGD
jgi:hypothetical protein